MRYYFDIQDDFFSVSDDEGTEYASIEAAKREAIVTATSIAKDVSYHLAYGSGVAAGYALLRSGGTRRDA